MLENLKMLGFGILAAVGWVMVVVGGCYVIYHEPRILVLLVLYGIFVAGK